MYDILVKNYFPISTKEKISILQPIYQALRNCGVGWGGGGGGGVRDD